MPIDTGIYSNIKQFEMPSYADSQAKAMSLSQMAMQNDRMAGQISAEDQQRKQAEQMQKTHAVGSALESMSGLSPQERARMYPQVRNKLVSQGLLGDQDAPAEYDDGFYKQNLYQYQQTKEYLDNQKTKAEINNLNRRNSGGGEYDPYKMLQTEKLREELEAKKFAKTPAGRLKNLGAEEAKRLDNAKLGLISTQGMADALNAGDNTFSLIGDNNFTQQRALFEEALGRMQSGGAISKPEEERFKKMAPTLTDSAEMRLKKLSQLQAEMKSRIGTLGFNPEDVGVAYNPIKLNKDNGFSVSDGTPRANASTVDKITNEDAEALFWARKNKKDPRAQQILNLHGEK